MDSNNKPLEYWITRAADPFISDAERVGFLDGLCERIDSESDGAQVAVRLLGHKLLSPDQNEALHSVKVLDLCIRVCGSRFQEEISKFRFLNHFVKLLSPKYNGDTTSEIVRNFAIELLFVWQRSLRCYPKIKEVYDMLKEQNVILSDPEISTATPNVVAKPRRLATFEDEERAMLLSQLLQSKNKEDLQAANRLIKGMVKSENQRLDRMHRRVTAMEKAKCSVRILDDMLSYGFLHKLTAGDLQTAKELHDSLTNMRSTLYQCAGEAAESGDNELVHILSLNDVINKTLENYQKLVKNEIPSCSTDELIVVDCNNCELKTSSTDDESNTSSKWRAEKRCHSYDSTSRFDQHVSNVDDEVLLITIDLGKPSLDLADLSMVIESSAATKTDANIDSNNCNNL